MKTIIGLTGLKTSGKTTAFNAIKDVYPEIVEIQLAKKLKDVCAEFLGVDRVLFDDPARKEVKLEEPVYLEGPYIEAMIKSYGFVPDYDKHVRPHVGTVLESPRRIAQYVGTEVLRNVDDQIHCKGAVMDLPEEGLFVLTDMRFPNEYDFFANHYECNFYPYYIQSYRAEAAGAGDMHPSERMVLETAKNCTAISNNASQLEFEYKVADLTRNLLAKAGINTAV